MLTPVKRPTNAGKRVLVTPRKRPPNVECMQGGAGAERDEVMLKPVKRPANAWKEAYECGVRAGAHASVDDVMQSADVEEAQLSRMLTYAYVC
jgi:hypothetical protein